jgi:hypothetical protein
MGTVEGWRAWGIKADVESWEIPVLHSVTSGSHVWQPREVQIATCNKRKDHECPDERCSCGLYSAKTLEHLQSMTYHLYDAEAQGMFHVVGQVANWGKVIEGSQGWRAAKAYPAQLFVPYEAWHLAPKLQEAYGGPVRLKNILADDNDEEA